MNRTRHTLGHTVAYHGCDEVVGEKALAGKDGLIPSIQDYDWLGSRGCSGLSRAMPQSAASENVPKAPRP